MKMVHLKYLSLKALSPRQLIYTIVLAHVFFIFSLNDAIAGNTNYGSSSLSSVISGTTNSAFGEFTLQNLITGSDNTASEYTTLFNNTLGSGNAAVGNASIRNNSTGYENSVVAKAVLI